MAESTRISNRASEASEDIEVADISAEYDIAETLGTGHFAKVKLATNRKTGTKVAIKIITKPKDKPKSAGMLKTEVDILTRVDHRNIVKMYEVYDTPNKLYLVMELLTGGELFDRIVAKGHFSEEDARKLSKSLLGAILYLHKLGIAHRDLKPENILLKHDGEDADIKITDFGLSKIFSDDLEGEVVMKTACGTPGYVAPEVLEHKNYGPEVDLWGIGVIVYILLCGFPPFYGDNDRQLYKKIKAGQYKFIAPYWDPVSKEAKDFVSKLLVVDVAARMTAEDALKHKWISPKGISVSTKNLFAAAEAASARQSKSESAPPMAQASSGLQDSLAKYNEARNKSRKESVSVLQQKGLDEVKKHVQEAGRKSLADEGDVTVQVDEDQNKAKCCCIS